MVIGIREIYATYVESSESPIDYNTFKEILHSFNESAIQLLLEGGTLSMKHKLSTLSVWRAKRDPMTPKVNWGESNKLKAELLAAGKKLYDDVTKTGERWIVFFTDERYFRFRWYKNKCMLKNKSVYRFEACRGVKGKSPKERLTALIKSDDLAYLRFKEYERL